MEDYLFLNICYIVIIEDDELSFFNKYNKFLINKFAYIEKIFSLPKDVAELYHDKKTIISNRMMGIFPNYTVKFIPRSNMIIESPYKFNIIFTSQDIEISDKNTFNLMVFDKLGTDANNDIVNLNDLNFDYLKKFITSKFSYLKPNEREIISFFEKDDQYSNNRVKTDLAVSENIFNKSNITALKSLNVDIHSSIPSNIFDYDKKEQEFIINCFNHIRSQIRKYSDFNHFLITTDYVISDLSSNVEFILSKKQYSGVALKNLGYVNPNDLEKTIKLINQNRISSKDINNDYAKEYIQERIFIEALITMICASYVIPNIKLPISNSIIVSKLVEIGRADRNQTSKINRLFNNLVCELNNAIGDMFDYFNKSYYSSLKIVSNLPIEWAAHQSLPLMIRHEVSRIPVSPGYLCSGMLTDAKNLIVTRNQISKIKIISSFQDNDHLKDQLKSCLDILDISLESEMTNKKLKSKLINDHIEILASKEQKEDLPLEILWRDVRNREDLLRSLNNDPTIITIFDLHGGHMQDEVGVIHLAEEAVSIHEIIKDFQSSPIIVLSACDTSSIDRNHLNVTNAFLQAGAKTVLASALPINSIEATSFIIRLLTRIQKYLPIALKSADIKWSSLVTGMLRRSYYSELIHLMRDSKQFKGTNVDIYELLFKIGCKLDPLHPEWDSIINNLICDEFSINESQLMLFIESNFMLPECLKYLQIGNPDLVVIASGKHLPLTK